jgi:mannose-6-phosphate isomerase-like protein (cupin superfamily)
MKAIEGYFLITPEDLHWRPSNIMKIPNADFLERTKSENLGARLWRLPPNSAGTLHKHIRAEEFYFVLEGAGRIRRRRGALAHRGCARGTRIPAQCKDQARHVAHLPG